MWSDCDMMSYGAYFCFTVLLCLDIRDLGHYHSCEAYPLMHQHEWLHSSYKNVRATMVTDSTSCHLKQYVDSLSSCFSRSCSPASIPKVDTRPVCGIRRDDVFPHAEALAPPVFAFNNVKFQLFWRESRLSLCQAEFWG